MKYQLHCERCRQPIAGFDELETPLTFEQFGPYTPGTDLPPKFGGENRDWTSFRCTRCTRWPFLTLAEDHITKIHPEKVRVAYTGDDAKDWYHIEEWHYCEDCDFRTKWPQSLDRHKRGVHGGR